MPKYEKSRNKYVTTYADVERQYSLAKQLVDADISSDLFDIQFLLEGLRDYMEWPLAQWEPVSIVEHHSELGQKFRADSPKADVVRTRIKLTIGERQSSMDARFKASGQPDSIWSVQLFMGDWLSVDVANPESVDQFYESAAQTIAKKAKELGGA